MSTEVKKGRQSENPSDPLLASAQKPTRTGEEVEELLPNGAKIRRRVDMPHSPTGKARAKIMLRSYVVKATHSIVVTENGKSKSQRETKQDTIEHVPGPAEAIREYAVKRRIDPTDWQFQATPIDGTEQDAGEVGYAANHRQDVDREAA